MIRHLVAFRFHDSVSLQAREEMIAELRTFPTRFPTMQRFILSDNISQRDATFPHAFAVEFSTEDELLTYLASEYHETFVRERWRPLIAHRAIVSLQE